MAGKKKNMGAPMLKLTPGQMKMIKSMMDKNDSAPAKKGKMKDMSAVKKGSKYKGNKKK